LVPPGGGTILDAIGNTPLIMVDGIWVKLEYLNPSGSIKARLARYMIERAEREGLLRPGDTIVEASSGNTGNAMSMVAAVKGYRMLVVMPNGMSGERQAISRAFGAQVTLGDFHVNDALAKVPALGQQPGYFAPQQFDSEWNVEENRTWLGPETLAQLPDGGPGRRGRRGRHRRDHRRRGPVLPRAEPVLPVGRRRAERVVHPDVRRGRPAPDRGHL
jgi:cysteine synthase A